MRLPVFLFLFFLVSCGPGKTDKFRLNNCKGSPQFVKLVAGFNPASSYFSTSEMKKMGLVLVENAGTSTAPSLKYYQHPSWSAAGWLSPIQLDNAGNIYTSPAPFINTWNNPPQKQNTIYRVDAVRGEMTEFISLPLPDTITTTNPYGVLGLVYFCEGNILYASSIAGSDRRHINGVIYAIDLKTKKIIDELHGHDAIGMGISYITGQRRLYFGTGRSSEVFSVRINASGKFTGEVSSAFSLEGLGNRGDDKVRRIRSDEKGNLVVYGIEFNYNLIAPREKPETLYNVVYASEKQQWLVSTADSRSTTGY